MKKLVEGCETLVYKTEDVCAVIVSYNCDKVINENINALKKQVGRILIIDNASTIISKNILSANEGILIIYNEFNEGIGRALNQGLDFAQKNNFKLLLTMDQDTVLCENAVQKMIDVLNVDTSIVSVGPVYQTDETSTLNLQYVKVTYLITSGNLTCVDSAISAGGYNEELFIDSVDFDFALTLQEKGNRIAKVQNAHMKHFIGEKEKAKFLFLEFEVQSHSPLRHYYIYRNHIYIMKKYFFKYPVFCCKKQIISMLYLFQLLLVQTQKKEKILMIIKGAKDAIRNNYGKLS